MLAIESVPLALWAHARHASFEAAVIEAAGAAGDTDSIAAMTGALAGARYGASAIPSTWIAATEPRGRAHVAALAARLAASA